MTEKEITPLLQDLLRAYIQQFGTLRDTARHLGVSPPQLCQMRAGKKPIPDWLLPELGVERCVTYRIKPK